MSASSPSARLPIGLLAVLLAAAGLVGGFGVGYAWQTPHSPAAAATYSAVPVVPLAPAASERAAAFRDWFAAFQAKAARSPEDHLELLRTLDLWLAEDPFACANELYAIGAGNLLPPETLAALFTRVYGGSAALQIRKAREIVSPEMRDAVVEAVFRHACDTDPRVALDLISALPRHQWRLRTEAGKALGKIVDAADMPALMKHPSMDHNILQEVLRGWIDRDTKATLDFLEQTDDADFRRFGQSKDGYSQSFGKVGDPELKLAFFAKQPRVSSSSSNEAQCYGSMLAQDPSRWDEVMARGDNRRHLSMIASDAAQKVVITSPQAAADILQRIPGEEARKDATMRATREFLGATHMDPAPVLAWAKSISDPIVARRIIEELRFQKVPLPPDVK